MDIYEVWERVTQLAFETGGNYSVNEVGGRVPPETIPDVMKNGASYFCYGLNIFCSTLYAKLEKYVLIQIAITHRSSFNLQIYS